MAAQPLEWITLNDFRPGVKGRVSPADISHNRGTILGVASKNGTFRCWGQPDGSLGPMPKRSHTVTVALPLDTTILTNDRLTISGMHIAGPVRFSVEAHLAYEGIVSGSPDRRRYYWDRIRLFDANQVDSLFSFVPTAENPVSPNPSARPTWFYTWRANATDATLPGLPIVVAAWFEATGGTISRFWKMFPDPDTPTSLTPGNIPSVSSTYTPVISQAHQGRSVIVQKNQYSHGTASTADDWTADEDIHFTNSNLQTEQNPAPAAQTFGEENATGYRVMLSTSYSELFFVKRAEGGLLVRGDIADPTVLRLPGIPGAGAYLQQACNSPVGAIYFTDSGVYVWNGGEVAENISSESLTNDLNGGGDFDVDSDFVDFFGRSYYWHDWVLFPNNWAWDYRAQSWWRLEDPEDIELFWMGPQDAVISQYLWCAPAHVATGEPQLHRFDYNTPVDDYQWTSLPIPLGTDREIMIREVVVVATGEGDVDLTFTNTDNTEVTYTFTFALDTAPTSIRLPTNVRMTHLQLEIVAEKAVSGTVPVIHEIRLGTDERTHTANAQN